MDIRLARNTAMAPLLYRHQDDHAPAQISDAPASKTAALDGDAADVARLTAWLESIGETIDATGLPQSGPADAPLAMKLQALSPAWFSSLLEILGFASWRRAPEGAVMQSEG